MRERLAAAGRARVEAHFSWDAIAGRTLALYRDVVAEHAATTPSV